MFLDEMPEELLKDIDNTRRYTHGYSPTEATKAVRQVTITEDMNSEAVLKASLKFLAF